MNSNTHNELSHLLDAFYSGSASPADIRRLGELLEKDPDSLYNADRRLLTALSTLSEIRPPKEMQQSISDALNSASRPSHPRQFPLIITLLAAAAVIAAIAIIGFRFLNQSTPSPASQRPLAKVESVLPADSAMTPPAGLNSTHLPAHSSKTTAKKIRKAKTASLSSPPSPPSPADSSACKEITDPAEAVAYVENLLASIDLDLSPIDRASDRINKNFETINNLLQ